MILKALRLSAYVLALTFGPISISNAQNISSTGWTSYLQLNPLLGYTYANIYGQGTVPTYKGLTYGAEITYLVGTPAFSMAPFFAYKSLSLENTSNSSLQKESLSGSQLNYGVMAVSHSMYLKASYSQLRIKDEVRGQINNSKNLKSDGVELGAGVTYKFTPMIWSSLGLDLNTFKFDPAKNPITDRLDYVSYTLMFSINIGIPSGPLDLLP